MRLRHAACTVAALIALGAATSLAAPALAGSREPATRAQQPAERQARIEPSRAIVVTDEMRAHERWVDALYFADHAFQIALLAALLALGAGCRLRLLAARAASRPFPVALVTAALFILLMAILSFPMIWLGDFWVPHHFGLSDQSPGSWLADQGKGLLVGLAVGAPLLALAFAVVRRMRRWWLGLWLASVPLLVLLQIVVPIALDPIFNTFEPLKDQQLKVELLDLASKAGIAGGRVYEVDKSRQTNTLNAYVNGLGPTKRIVLWDTIIAAMDRDELKFVMAHEMGHYVLGHMWALLAFAMALLLLSFWAGQRIVERATAAWGSRWGFAAPGDPAALPLLALVASVFVFLSTPATSAFSRHLERQADTFAIELTHLNDAGVRAFIKLAENAKVLPDPPPVILFWRYTHPAISERIAECRRYRPWKHGEPNRVWRPGD
jgi:Zn-dependent protease with chaperone function